MQIQTLIMVRPRHFGYNAETALSNTFQHPQTEAAETVAQKALAEFDAAVDVLRSNNIPVRVFDDLPGTLLPDSVFPNNWFSTHPGGRAHVYPMLTPSRQAEVRTDILDALKHEFGYAHIHDYRSEQGICEGTGSLVFDHENRTAYAVLSPRTDQSLAEKIIRDLGYTPFFLEASADGKPIYHTNVLMCCAPEFTVICLDALAPESLERFVNNPPGWVLPITLGQMNTFAGNMLAVDTETDKFIILSETAQNSLMRHQREYIAARRKIVTLHIPTIETLGGGSARCMLAEIF